MNGLSGVNGVKGKRVLVTSGGTREPIDGVRVMTNSSTGGTGAYIADTFVKNGADVVLLRAEGAVKPVEARIVQRTFVTATDLDMLSQQILGSQEFDLIIHAAAVSDFIVESLEIDGVKHAAPLIKKLPSSSALSLHLRPGKKILPHLKDYSRNREVQLVGFKLSDGASAAEAQQAVHNVLASGADWVVHNDLSTMRQQRAMVWSKAGSAVVCATLDELARHLVALGSVADQGG